MPKIGVTNYLGTQMNRLSELIADLIHELERSSQCPTMQELHDLSTALHGSMCKTDAPELLWMKTSFEEVADCIFVAEKCAAIDEHQREVDYESKVKKFRLNGGM